MFQYTNQGGQLHYNKLWELEVRAKLYQSYFVREKYVQICSFHFYFNPSVVKCFFQFVLNLLGKIETFHCVMLLLYYPVPLMMISEYFPVIYIVYPRR